MTTRSFISSHRNCRRFLAATHHAAILNNYSHDLQMLHFTVERGHDLQVLQFTVERGAIFSPLVLDNGEKLHRFLSKALARRRPPTGVHQPTSAIHLSTITSKSLQFVRQLASPGSKLASLEHDAQGRRTYMKLIQCGSGLHAREVKCAEALKAALPDNWYAYSNLDLVLSRANTREVDLVIISDHYIFVADAKDWYGKIESSEGKWFQNGQDRGASPAKKIVEIQRKVYVKLQGHLKARRETRNLIVPRVIGLVLMSGSADYSGITDLEADNVLSVGQFIRIAKNTDKFR